MSSNQNGMPEPRVASVDELARILKISRGAAYQAVKRKEIPTIRIGKRLLVPLAALERMLDVGVLSGTAIRAGRNAGNRRNNMDTNKDTDAAMTMDEIRDWVASRKAAAATIDIETCELGWWHGEVLDPYGLLSAQGELPEEMRQFGTIYFVSSPDSGGWVNSQDLSPDQVKAMHARFEREYRGREDLPF